MKKLIVTAAVLGSILGIAATEDAEAGCRGRACKTARVRAAVYRGGSCQVQSVQYSHPVYSAACQPQGPPTAPEPGLSPLALGYGDPLAEVNAIRSRYGLRPVAYDPQLAGEAATNNAMQSRAGLGHHYLGSARRQNAAMGTGNLTARWMASPPHAAAILDPTVTRAGIASNYGYATLSLR